MRFIGWELRQDDETVWMQLVHLAKQSRTSYAEFTPYSFIKAIKWTVCGASYKRLLESIMRLDASSLVIYSRRFHKGVSISLIADFEFSRGTKEPWKVRVFDQKGKLLALFDKLYSRIDFKMRLALPEGVTTWLHSFLASHQAPCYHKIETLAVGAGITLDPPEDESLEEIVRIAKRKERLRAAKKIIRRSLEKLQEIKFLENFEITRNGLVRIEKNQKHNRKLLTSTSKKTINL